MPVVCEASMEARRGICNVISIGEGTTDDLAGNHKHTHDAEVQVEPPEGNRPILLNGLSHICGNHMF
eukprot:2845910-Pyramimonas_sp.AAC.1